ncbi:DUF262 domain-containing protein [Dermabacteraceae bacterium P13264]
MTPRPARNIELDVSHPPIKELLGGSARYRIPRFQREYAWTLTNAQEFWNDITNDNSSKFLGVLVLCGHRGEELEIVDGQQRTLTLQLMLAAIRDELKELASANSGEDIAREQSNMIHWEYIAAREYSDLSSRLRVRLPEGHATEISRILSFDNQDSLTETPPRDPNAPNNFTQAKEEKTYARVNYEFFRKKLSELTSQPSSTGKQGEILIDILDRTLALTVVKISIGAEEDAYTIFETLNSRGVNLTATDLTKNLILKHLPATETDRNEEKWREIFSVCDRNKNLEKDDFLWRCWASREGYTPKKQLYKDILSSVSPESKSARTNAKKILTNLSKDSVLYHHILNPGEKPSWGRQEMRRCKQALELLRSLKVSASIPFIIALLRRYEAKELRLRDLETMLTSLESYHFRYNFIAGKRSSGGVSSRYAKYAKEATNMSKVELRSLVSKVIEDLEKSSPTFEEFEAGYKAKRYLPKANGTHRDANPAFKDVDGDLISKNLANYTLSRYLKHTRKSLEEVPLESLTIEHAAPQSAAGKMQWTAEHIGQFGNLLLLPKEINTELGDTDWPTKLKTIKEAGCEIWIPDEMLNIREWRPDKAELRTKTMANTAFYEIWKIS